MEGYGGHEIDVLLIIFFPHLSIHFPPSLELVPLVLLAMWRVALGYVLLVCLLLEHIPVFQLKSLFIRSVLLPNGRYWKTRNL